MVRAERFLRNRVQAGNAGVPSALHQAGCFHRKSPIFTELHRLVVKTVGVVGPLRRALAPFAKRIAAAFVYGSIAKRTDTTRSET